MIAPALSLTLLAHRRHGFKDTRYILSVDVPAQDVHDALNGDIHEEGQKDYHVIRLLGEGRPLVMERSKAKTAGGSSRSHRCRQSLCIITRRCRSRKPRDSGWSRKPTGHHRCQSTDRSQKNGHLDRSQTQKDR